MEQQDRKQCQIKKYKYILVIFMLSLLIPAMFFHSVPTSASEISSEQLQEELEKRIKKSAEYEKTLVTSPTCATLGGEWTVIPLARSGYITDEFRDTYLANLRDTLAACNGQLHARKYTEFSRVTLALAALGIDPSDIFGYDMLSYLADYDNVIWQGVNGPVFALLAIDSRGYELPQVGGGKTQATRENLIARILDQQLSNGGWNLTGDESDAADADVTAMALQALAPYSSDEAVAKAIKKGTNRLSWMQKSDGGYISYNVVNTESCAQVVIAMAALGIEPDDSRFTKNGHTVLERMLSFYKEDGSFSHVDNGSADMMSTDQGYLAMVAVLRYLKGESFLYDMKDKADQDISEITIPEPTTRKPDSSVSAPAPSATTTAKKDSTKKASAKKIKITKLTLNRKSLSLKVGKTATIKVKVKPSNATNKEVTWKSSNKRIATVTKTGKIKGIRAGTATITATAKDGSKKKTACKVTVKKASAKKSKKKASGSGRSGTGSRSGSGNSGQNYAGGQQGTIPGSARSGYGIPTASAGTGNRQTVTGNQANPFSGSGVNGQASGGNGNISGNSGNAAAESGSAEASTEAGAWSFDGDAYVPESAGRDALEENPDGLTMADGTSFADDETWLEEEQADAFDESMTEGYGDQAGNDLPLWLSLLLGLFGPGALAGSFMVPWSGLGNRLLLLAFRNKAQS